MPGTVTSAASTPTLSAILCADWGKEFKKRSVYVADVARRLVRRVDSVVGWSLAQVLMEAWRWSPSGPVLAAFDVPLGIPQSYLSATRSLWPDHPPATFLDLLARAASMPQFFTGSASAGDWTVERPFFAVPSGPGGLTSYADAAARLGVDLHRSIDRRTGAKSVFIKSGIPGSVGSSACAFWQELGPQLTVGRTFKVWPFEGDLSSLLESTSVIVGEMYPRAAYATALLEEPPPSRPQLAVAKTDARARHRFVAQLREARWVGKHGVTIEDLDHAEASEDDFDACVTAAALLRCVLDGTPLCPPQLDFPATEGGILGTGSVNLQLRPRHFVLQGGVKQAVRPAFETPRQTGPGGVEQPNTDAPGGVDRSYRCPIAGCDKIFRGSRGGWDAHVASVRTHREWHPDIKEPEDRRRRFEAEFPDFFAG